MHEIICPHCSKAFKIDEAGYADILKQVRDGDFEKQLHERLELAEREKRDAIALAEAKVANELQKAAAAKDTEIQALKAQLDAGEVTNKLALAEELGTVEKQRDAIANELAQAKQDQQAALKLAEAQLTHKLQSAAAHKDTEIQALQAQLDAAEVARRLAVTEALGAGQRAEERIGEGPQRTASRSPAGRGQADPRAASSSRQKGRRDSGAARQAGGQRHSAPAGRK